MPLEVVPFPSGASAETHSTEQTEDPPAAEATGHFARVLYTFAGSAGVAPVPKKSVFPAAMNEELLAANAPASLAASRPGSSAMYQVAPWSGE